MFKTIPEMILHYLTFPIDKGSKQILGIGCDREGKSNNIYMMEGNIPKNQLYIQSLVSLYIATLHALLHQYQFSNM